MAFLAEIVLVFVTDNVPDIVAPTGRGEVIIVQVVVVFVREILGVAVRFG